LPDGIFFKPKIPICVFFSALAMEGVGIFYGHLVYIVAILYILLFLVSYYTFWSKKNLATLVTMLRALWLQLRPVSIVKVEEKSF
jgi:hypothetical protein